MRHLHRGFWPVLGVALVGLGLAATIAVRSELGRRATRVSEVSTTLRALDRSERFRDPLGSKDGLACQVGPVTYTGKPWDIMALLDETAVLVRTIDDRSLLVAYRLPAMTEIWRRDPYGYNPDVASYGDKLYAKTRSGNVERIDPGSGATLFHIESAHPRSLREATFIGGRLLLDYGSQGIAIHDAGTGTTIARSDDPCTNRHLMPLSRRIVFEICDGKVSNHEIERWRKVGDLDFSNTATVVLSCPHRSKNAVDVENDPDSLCVAHEESDEGDRLVGIKASTGETVWRTPFPLDSRRESTVAFLSDRLALLSTKQGVQALRLSDGRLLTTLEGSHDGEVIGVRHGRVLVWITSTAKLLFYDAVTLGPIGKVDDGADGWAFWDPSEKRVATFDGDVFHVYALDGRKSQLVEPVGSFHLDD